VLNLDYPIDGDPNCTLMQYWAFIEVIILTIIALGFVENQEAFCCAAYEGFLECNIAC
jgi:hypothetical protein